MVPARRPAAQAAAEGAAPDAAPPPRPWPGRPPAPEERAATAASKAAALAAAAEVLRAAGLHDEAETMGGPAAQHLKEASSAKPGARLDSCAAFVARAERRVAAAEAEVEAAAEKLEATRARAAELTDELAEGRRRLAELRAGLHEEAARDDLLGDVRTLLDAFEGLPVPGHVGAGPQPPEGVLEAMRVLRQRVAPPADGRTSEERLNSALEPRSALAAAPTAARAAAIAPELMDASGVSDGGLTEEDDLMNELDDVDASNDAALLEVARRLKRARCL